MSLIILPSEVGGRDELVKQLRNAIRPKSPAEAEYEKLRTTHGLDNETARDISGWHGGPSGPVEDAVADVRYASVREEPAQHVKYVAAVETQGSMRRVGEAAGAAVGSAAGIGILRLATQHATTLVFGGTLLTGAVVAGVGAKVVATSIGKVAAALFVLNIASATALAAFALTRRR